jgi:hypothetical protein
MRIVPATEAVILDQITFAEVVHSLMLTHLAAKYVVSPTAKSLHAFTESAVSDKMGWYNETGQHMSLKQRPEKDRGHL